MAGKSIVAVAVVGMVCVAGCNNHSRNHLGETMQVSEARGSYHERFTHMADNAAMQDSSIADLHFIPHSAELSSTGMARLDRLAPIYIQYGGVLRYESRLNAEDPNVQQRLVYVHEYLENAGCDMARVTIKMALPGGRGMTSAEAIAALEEGTVNDYESGSSGSIADAMGGGA